MTTARILIITYLLFNTFGKTQDPTPVLEIGPRIYFKEPAHKLDPIDKGIQRENGLTTRRFIVPPTFLTSGATLSDEFVDKPTPKQILEQAGVSFNGPSTAIYNQYTSQLVVTNKPEQLSLVENYVESLKTEIEINLQFRLEIYELPSLTALEATESASQWGNHEPERNAVLNLAKKGEAKLVTISKLLCRSGNRSKTEDITKVKTLTGFSKSISDDQQNPTSEFVPNYEEKGYGLTFEIDPVLAADKRTIDINFSIEFHTAPPHKTITTFSIEGTDETKEGESLAFHTKRITAQVSSFSGNYLLIGNWKPTGKGYENTDLMHIAFLHTAATPNYDILKLDEQEN